MLFNARGALAAHKAASVYKVECIVAMIINKHQRFTYRYDVLLELKYEKVSVSSKFCKLNVATVIFSKYIQMRKTWN